LPSRDAMIETIEQAGRDLERAGLQVGDVKNYRPNGVVVSQDPSGGDGTTALRGSRVDLVLSKKGG